MGTKDCIVVGTEDGCLVVVAVFVVVTIVGTENVDFVLILVVVVIGGSWGSRSDGMAEGDGKAARRMTATMRTLTRFAAFIC